MSVQIKTSSLRIKDENGNYNDGLQGITIPTPTDPTLTIEGAPADAKAVGDRIGEVEHISQTTDIAKKHFDLPDGNKTVRFYDEDEIYNTDAYAFNAKNLANSNYLDRDEGVPYQGITYTKSDNNYTFTGIATGGTQLYFWSNEEGNLWEKRKWWIDKYNINVGDTLTFYVFSNKGNPDSTRFYIDYYDANGNVIGGSNKIYFSRTKTVYSIDTIVPEGTAYFQYYMFIVNAGEIDCTICVGIFNNLEIVKNVDVSSNCEIIGSDISTLPYASDVSYNYTLKEYIDSHSSNVVIDEYVTPEQFGAVGDGIVDDTNSVKLAIATGKKVLMQNKYYITSTIEATDLEMEFCNSSYTKIQSNIDVFHLHGKCLLYGNGLIKINNDNYTNAVITLYGGTNFSVIDLNIEGYHTDYPSGVGVRLYADDKPIVFVNIKGTYQKFGKAIEIMPVYSYITGCNFDIISLYNTYVMYNEYERNDVYDARFGACFIRANGEAAHRNNVTDYSMYFKYIENTTINNSVIDIGRSGYEPYPIKIDSGKFNIIEKSSEGIKSKVDSTSTIDVFNTVNKIIEPKPIAGILDYLAYADLKYNVSFETFGNGTIIEENNVFNFSYDGKMLKYKNPNYKTLNVDDWGVIVTIDFNKIIHASMMTLTVSNENEQPSKVYVSYKNENGIWSDYVIASNSDIELRNGIRIYDLFRRNSCYGLKIKFAGNRNSDTYESDTVKIYDIALGGYEQTTFGQSFNVISKYGGTVHGDLNFDTGKGSILTSPNGTKYRLKVDDNGRLITESA